MGCLVDLEAEGGPINELADLAAALGGNTAAATWLCGKLDESTAAIGEHTTALDTGYMLISAYMVFMMQAGFAMLCAGSVRSKNTMNILLKNVLDACVGSIAFWSFGFGFAFGEDSGRFIGKNTFFTMDLLENEQSWNFFLFQWAFAAAAATIVSGSVAERTSISAYFGYSVFLTGFAYPVVVHWVWAGDGWLSAWRDKDLLLDCGMCDFAGSGVVHMVGGFAGLMGAYFVGPRVGRFDAEGNVMQMPGHSATLVVLGTFVLWFGWYGFNPGSALAMSDSSYAVITGRSAVTTTLAAGTAGVTALFLTFALTKSWDLLAVCNGLLAGLVSITAGCPFVECYAAIIAGFFGAFIFQGSSALLRKLKIDDPLEAAPMHGFCGAWGVIFTGLFATKDYTLQVLGRDEFIDNDDGTTSKNPIAKWGAFYGGGGNMLGCNICGVLAIMTWTSGLLGLFFFVCSKAGILRVSMDEEMVGLDVSKHGGSAYNMEDNLKSGSRAPM
eukprot:CAMPEP_0182860548 /NCGR_PEP_ID=MMETSP0034_2-20130328/4979_1 /TAXON_ID=156128 /ORGANISM="Nephroselmis pyriformis, Strain CCMP717" /LENGTH=497 /DNA_ID=CAMNT_0024992355 /DNA_START=226 /DNA_END=1719 /DNA_ORIENTATION=-